MFYGLEEVIGSHLSITPDENELRVLESMIYMLSGRKATARYSTKWSHKNKNDKRIGECNDYEIDFWFNSNETLERFFNYLVGNNRCYIVITGVSARGGKYGTET